MANCQASFKNSRIFPRPTTLTAITDEITIATSAGPPTEVRPANSARTYLTIRNVGTEKLRYGYGSPSAAFLLTDGFALGPGEAIDLESPERVAAISETGSTTTLHLDEGSG